MTGLGHKRDTWINLETRMPKEFHLVELLYNKNIYSGWWTGYAWDGSKVPQKKKPDAWRPMKYNCVERKWFM